jgi:hypothetical protein
MNSGRKMSSSTSMVGLRTTAQNERYVSGSFDNKEKILDKE